MGYYARNPYERIAYVQCDICERRVDPTDAEILKAVTPEELEAQIDTCGDAYCIEEAREQMKELTAPANETTNGSSGMNKIKRVSIHLYRDDNYTVHIERERNKAAYWIGDRQLHMLARALDLAPATHGFLYPSTLSKSLVWIFD